MKYYTYIHATPDGEIFYVGKGCGHRAFSTGKRSLAWRQVVADNNGITIKIVSYFDTEQEAFEHEKKLISFYRKENASLVNKSEGGLGPLGYCQTVELRAHKAKLMRNYTHELITCPNCGFTGGAPATRRWHFDNCKGLRLFKARTTVKGKRVFLGNYPTKMEAQSAVEQFMSSQPRSIV
jgi:hypothetical protein